MAEFKINSDEIIAALRSDISELHLELVGRKILIEKQAARIKELEDGEQNVALVRHPENINGAERD